MEYLLLASCLLSFILTIVALPKWIRVCRKIGMTWEDMNKFSKPKNIAASGGVVVIMAFLLGVLFYIALRTLLIGETSHMSEIFALLTMILIFGIIGLVDDMLGWKHGGLSNRLRLILAAIASIPLIVINAWDTSMVLPFLGSVHFGIIYPLVIIPLGVVGASTTFNFLAGYNGLESGQGVLILSFLSFVAYSTGSPWLGIVGLCMVGALLGFWFFNRFPAQVFPGDILTYGVGALIAGMAILGNFEKIAFIVFIPYVFEVILKLRGRLKIYSFGIPRKDGTLKMPSDKICGLEHLAIKLLGHGATEKKVVYLIHLLQVVFILIAFLTL